MLSGAYLRELSLRLFAMLQIKKDLSHEIALSGMGTALTVICIVLSYYIPVMTLTLYALSGITLMLPLIKNKLRSGLLCYVASGILGLLFTNYFAILPFALLFGSGSLVMYVCLKYLPKKWFLSIPIKIVFANLGLFGIYKLMGLESITGIFEWVGISPKYIWIALIFTPLYIAYDYLLQRVFRYLRARFNKRLKSASDKSGSDNEPYGDL